MKHFKTVEEFENKLYSHGRSSESSDGVARGNLHAVIEFMTHFDSIQDKQKIIHVVGTNGKGSTVTYIENILMAEDKKVLKYTSPHIVDFNERIQVNGTKITYEELEDIYFEICDVMKKTNIKISFIQLLTCIAIIYGYRKKCDYIILEAGVGARLDPSNIVKKPVAVAMTNIAIDHVHLLGETISEITNEKAHCIKKDCDLFVIDQDDEVMNIIKDKSKKMNASLNIIEPAKIIGWNPFEIEIDDLKFNPKNIATYQAKNIALATSIAKHLKISKSNIIEGINKANWVARMQQIKENIIIDGAHNVSGIKEFVNTVKNFKQDFEIIYSGVSRKDHQANLSLLDSLNKPITVTSFPFYDSLNVSDINNTFNNVKIDDNFIKLLEKAQKKEGLTIFVGSLYFSGEIIKIINK